MINGRKHDTTRRGIAMMLVLISLFTAVIITSAYLASRDNSTAIGANIRRATEARWAATSALDIGVAIMETKTDWRSGHINGKLLDDVVLGNAIVDIDILDLETGLPPTEDTVNLQLTATATVRGVMQKASAMAVIQEGLDTEIDLDLSEFAVFASESLTVKDNAMITRWPESPVSKLAQAIAIGTQATDAGSIDFMNNGAAIDSTVYHSPAASISLVLTGTGPDLGMQEVPDTIPFPISPAPSVAPPADDAKLDHKYEITASGWIMSNEHHTCDVTLKSSAGKVGFDSSVTQFIVDGDLTLEAGVGLVVNSDLEMVVFGDLDLNTDSYIYLQGDSTLRLHIGGTLDVKDAAIGSYRSGSTRDTSGYEPWIDPSRIEIYGMNASEKVFIKGDSAVAGSLYFPTYDIKIQNESAVYGRIAGANVVVQNESAVFYDHKLYSNTGYTNFSSKIYRSADGSIEPLVKLIAILDPSLVAAAADLLGVRIKVGDEVYGSATETVPVAMPGDPTPRVVPIEFEIEIVGTDVVAWEQP
jgi:hypothetical protein